MSPKPGVGQAAGEWLAGVAHPRVHPYESMDEGQSLPRTSLPLVPVPAAALGVSFDL